MITSTSISTTPAVTTRATTSPVTGNTTENTTSMTTIENTTAATTSGYTTNATSDMYPSIPNSPPKDHNGAIVGGVIGGALLVAVVIVFVVVVYRWRRRSKQRNSREHVLPPHKERLEQIETERALKAAQQNQPGLHNTNTNVESDGPYLNADGPEVIMKTYPAEDLEGYMKKGYGGHLQPQYKPEKKGRRKKGNKKEALESGNVRSSMPIERAPSVPHSSQYQVKNTNEDAHLQMDARLSEKSSQYIQGGVATVPDSEKPIGKYVNLGPQKKGEAVFGIQPKSTANSTPRSNRAKTKQTQPDDDIGVSKTTPTLDVSSGANTNTYANDTKPYVNLDHLGKHQYYNEGAIIGLAKEMVEDIVYEDN
ncbi:uncharacterized protein LOC127851167 [Dreissena polymorpha]|uniref:Uncharacterized protein n=1 Tax=Dreissena polymorpha TaxID=45954 RepID=A0A9D4CYE8_DREPO|nr:uncharacterized protein LOC127851167 [Dreissena polymorpha]XP_052240745.1 uncharacterized protein LOC127851167 [Dreissena polymorpha]XP_052240746.1 uncharacterized protein LOC127851167 [Dreissena polymorpha]XP_052240747.1 uncharacterized protein LOC127851167 [Dreissena polymorpha]KAH3735542.1 hypothetical protein DPMN_042078 [Dreissena polymorpha]